MNPGVALTPPIDIPKEMPMSANGFIVVARVESKSMWYPAPRSDLSESKSGLGASSKVVIRRDSSL